MERKNEERSDEDAKDKKRGRKREKWEIYKEKANEKIKKLQEKLQSLKDNKGTVGERYKLRNQISAQQSRIKQRMQVMHLNKIIQDKDDKINNMTEFFLGHAENASNPLLDEFVKHMQDNWKEYESDTSCYQETLSTYTKSKIQKREPKTEKSIPIDETTVQKFSRIIKDKLITKTEDVNKYQ